jgi:hypothetical protein
MAPRFGNTAYSYRNKRGKPVFVPSHAGRKIARELRIKLDETFIPDSFFYHLRKGGHVDAIHLHRPKRYFARVDIENFFYSVGRNDVARALQRLGLAGGERYARWSTVRNPFAPPTYALPYGFVQSPILATLVLARSPAGDFLREIADKVVVTVFMDDIAISGNNRRVLERAYKKLRRKLVASKFPLNEAKSFPPSPTIDLFNCHLDHMRTLVTEARREQFCAEERSPRSEAAFDTYCAVIARGNEG